MRLASSQYSDLPGISPQVGEFVSRFFLVKDALGRTACGKVAKFKDELPPVDTSEVRIYKLSNMVFSKLTRQRLMCRSGAHTG